MVNTSNCTLYELWNARYSAKGSTAGSGAIWHLTSNRLRPAGWTSADGWEIVSMESCLLKATFVSPTRKRGTLACESG